MTENMNGPRSIGIILDGNRRWAKERGLPTIAGHTAGYENAKNALDWAAEAGVEFLTLYSFSTENWNRPEEEVNYLISVIRLLERDIENFKKKGYRFRVIGDRSRFPHDVQEMLVRAESETILGTVLTVVCALSYGGQDEILAAVNVLLADTSRAPGAVTKDELAKYMWSAGIPFPDLIIRTGGEQRLSNFLTWQSVYSELFFVQDYWPAFSKEQFLAVLEEYGERERRFGK